MLRKMGVKSGTMYAAGFASIGLSVASWLASRSVEHAGVDRADRWGIFVGQWAPTFFALGVALRIEETHGPEISSRDTHGTRDELIEAGYAEGRMPSRTGV
ncbi:hypothetical protein ACFYY8_19670 [Streptosporangium sp. NPDC001559]|uniref:hypothetical protein n=1 Tax=Streptosporangium sp. NPDC001559 TaxID=3366187 RepID=UPI0036E49E9E